MDEDEAAILRQWITGILRKTTGARELPGDIAKSAPDKGSWRQYLDNLDAGRVSFYRARQDAQTALRLLEEGEREAASWYLHLAMWQYANALERRVQPRDLKTLGRASKRRGRKKK